MTSVEAHKVSCGYDGKTVLSGISLKVCAGEVVALIGANGSGKSTLMKTIAGAIKPISGAVKIQGDDVQALSKKETAKQIGYVPQFESPAFDFCVAEVVLMGRMPHTDGLFETKEDIEIALKAMARADLLPLQARPMSELSGGEGQRVRIARALAQEAPILLMDEPTTHLDVRHQIDIGRLVRSLANDGMAVIVAVHDLNWAAAYATRALLLCDGRIESDGPIDQVLASEVTDKAFDVTFHRVQHGGIRLLPNDEA